MSVEEKISGDRVRIRTVEPCDSEPLREIYRRSLERHPHGFVQNEAYNGDIVLRAETYRSEGGVMLVLMDRETSMLRGFGGLRRGTKAGHVELCNLHIDPAWTSLGLGKLLTRTLVAEARSRAYTTMGLHVTRTQHAALALYRQLGFVQTHRQIFTVLGKEYDTQFLRLNLES